MRGLGEGCGVYIPLDVDMALHAYSDDSAPDCAGIK